MIKLIRQFMKIIATAKSRRDRQIRFDMVIFCQNWRRQGGHHEFTHFFFFLIDARIHSTFELIYVCPCTIHGLSLSMINLRLRLEAPPSRSFSRFIMLYTPPRNNVLTLSTVFFFSLFCSHLAPCLSHLIYQRSFLFPRRALFLPRFMIRYFVRFHFGVRPSIHPFPGHFRLEGGEHFRDTHFPRVLQIIGR